MASARLNQPTDTRQGHTEAAAVPPGFNSGTVKEFGKIKDGKKTSYGWITDDLTGKDVFVHFTGIVSQGDKFRHLQSGQRVQFRIVTENGRQKAVDVEVIEGNAR